MFASSGFGLLALFSFLGSMLGGNRRRTSDSIDSYPYLGRWFR